MPLLFFYSLLFTSNLVAHNHQSLHIRQANDNLLAYAAYKMGQYETALTIWRRLAEQGNTTAMNNLANMYEQGQGVKADMQQSTHWLTQSAQHNNSLAQLQLAHRYEQGIGVAKNMHTAEKWFRRAMAQQEPEAFFSVAVIALTNYGKGSPSQAQIQEAHRLMQRAHALGYRDAAHYLPLIEAQLHQ